MEAFVYSSANMEWGVFQFIHHVLDSNIHFFKHVCVLAILFSRNIVLQGFGALGVYT